MVKVYQDETCSELIGVVKYNQRLDFYDGRNYQNGGLGCHKGITKLKRDEGPFVIIFGSDWQGESDYAYVVSDEEALDEIIESGNLDLLEEKKFERLNKLYEEKYSNIEELDD